MAELTFDTFDELSPSDFGAPFVAKNDDGSFKSFGVNYRGDTVWVNNKEWYTAWIDGKVMPDSIIVKEVQKITKRMDAQNMPVKLNGKQQYDPVVGEKTLEMVSLKTRTQLENEEANTIWEKLKGNRIRTKVLEEHNKYTEAATKAAASAVLSEDQTAALDTIMAEYGL